MLRPRPRRTAAVDEEEVNLTPLLDVVFIMLIFFIVTASFVKEPGVSVSAPEAKSATAQRLVSVLVAITSDNRIWINREEVPLAGVGVVIERLRRDNPKGSVMIRADASSHTRYTIEVLQQVRAVGVEDVVAVSTTKS